MINWFLIKFHHIKFLYTSISINGEWFFTKFRWCIMQSTIKVWLHIKGWQIKGWGCLSRKNIIFWWKNSSAYGFQRLRYQKFSCWMINVWKFSKSLFSRKNYRIFNTKKLHISIHIRNEVFYNLLVLRGLPPRLFIKNYIVRLRKIATSTYP